MSVNLLFNDEFPLRYNNCSYTNYRYNARKKKTKLFLEKVNPKDHVIKSLLEDDDKDPVSDKIYKLVNNNKMYICKAAYEKINKMLSNVGSNDEIEKYHKLLKKITIIDNEEDEVFCEATGKIWNEWTKATYETASVKRFTLLTGNVGATKSAYENGFTDIDIIVHRSRCLFGKERDKAVKTYKKFDKKYL